MAQPYTPEDPLLMIPGPTPISDAVRAALAAPVRGHATPENAASLARIRGALRTLVGAPGAEAYVLPGSGTLAMEIAVVNHVASGERVVVVNHGYFADRFVEICAVHGIAVDQARAEWGRAVDLDEVGRLLRQGTPPALLVVTHVDTSTGTQAEVQALARMAQEAGAMVLLDGICATGGIEEKLEEWGVDLLVTASQKALSVPPGLAVVLAGSRTRERREAIGGVPAYYMDLSRWDAAMTSTAYFATHATGLVRALDVSLGEILAEGLEARYRRHLEVAAEFRDAAAELGFSVLTDAPARAATMSVLRVPKGIDDAQLRADMLAQGVLVAGGIGPLAGVVIRVGHMGVVGRRELAVTLDALGRALRRQAG